MKMFSKTPLAVRALGVGAVLFGLAACQPVATVPGNGSIPGNGGAPAPTVAPTTTTAPPTTTTTTTAPASTTTTAVPAPSGWKLVGGDEFNDSTLDTSKWKPYHNNYGAGNLELECNTPSNVAEGGGSLKITAKKQTVACPNAGTYNYTSGFVGSRDVNKYYPRYARFEMRAKLPHAQGLWPAFWLRHRNGAGTAEV
ncbi:MAG TPA: family 16 glycosylhydrolase, partial [Acidimicrobiales bacterium]|nr:family 16 glycosylhydrolase [Acidimicrobiales bacterium]